MPKLFLNPKVYFSIMTSHASNMILATAILLLLHDSLSAQTYTIVGTGQRECYDDRHAISSPKPGDLFYGQDAQTPSLRPSYKDNGDGTITDLHTGLMWQKTLGKKISWEDAVSGAKEATTGGYQDWRLPTIKELYSLILFTGVSSPEGTGAIPFIDTKYFDFFYGKQGHSERQGERWMDVQEWSSTTYVGTTMHHNPTAFGVNFADGRIKGYPKTRPRGEPTLLYARYVRGNPEYGKNNFRDNGDGTISDLATGMQWSKEDNKKGVDWPTALAWVQQMNKENYLGHHDWRLPNIKELQSIVDYTRAPDAQTPSQVGPAIDAMFDITKASDGVYPCFWSSTTHLDGPKEVQAAHAAYVAFGCAMGWMQIPPQSGQYQLLNVHGAGAQRSDPKMGDPSRFPRGQGPQGDVRAIYNFVRLVRTESN